MICKNTKLKYPTKKLILSSLNWTKAKTLMASQFGADEILAKSIGVAPIKSRIVSKIHQYA